MCLYILKPGRWSFITKTPLGKSFHALFDSLFRKMLWLLLLLILLSLFFSVLAATRTLHCVWLTLCYYIFLIAYRQQLVQPFFFFFFCMIISRFCIYFIQFKKKKRKKAVSSKGFVESCWKTNSILLLTYLFRLTFSILSWSPFAAVVKFARAESIYSALGNKLKKKNPRNMPLLVTS